MTPQHRRSALQVMSEHHRMGLTTRRDHVSFKRWAETQVNGSTWKPYAVKA